MFVQIQTTDSNLSNFQINRSPIRSNGCHEILQSVQENQNSVIETLKLSVSETLYRFFSAFFEIDELIITSVTF